MSAVRCSCKRFLLAALAWVAVVVGPASAQIPPWPQPDGFDFPGACCIPATPNLPQFPSITQNIKYICWRDCQPSLCRDLCVTFGAPVPAAAGGVVFGCGVYFIPITIKRGAQVLYTGRLIGTYARTWLEDTIPGPVRILETQVWRFLLNGDLFPSAVIQGIANPCVAQCWRTFGAIYFTGYIDYRNFCPDVSWDVEWALDHGCDFWAHNPDSGRPAPAAGLHPNFSYDFVGPNTFTCSLSVPPSAGPVLLESVRSLIWNGLQPPLCLCEEPLVEGVMNPIQDFCPCGPPAGGAPQYVLTEFFGMGLCGSSFRTGTVGPKPFAQKRLGFFTNADGTPFKFLLLKMGDVEYIDACVPPPGNRTIEYFEGVETIGGFPAFTLNGQFLGSQFDDDGSSNFLVCQRRKGVPHIVCKIINANMP